MRTVRDRGFVFISFISFYLSIPALIGASILGIKDLFKDFNWSSKEKEISLLGFSNKRLIRNSMSIHQNFTQTFGN